MSFSLIDLISLLTLIQLLFLTVVIFNYKKGKKLSNLLLAGFMASNAFLIAHFLLARLGWISQHRWMGVHSIGNAAYLLLMPFLYLYIRSLCFNDFRLRNVHLLHFVPFSFFTVFMLLISWMNQLYVPAGPGSDPWAYLKTLEFWSHKIVMHCQILSYLVATTIMLSNYRKQLRDMYSSIEKIDLIWCNLLLVGFAAMWCTDLLNWMLTISHASTPVLSNALLIVSLVINLTFTLVVTYKGIAQSNSFSGIQAPPKYAGSRLTSSDYAGIVEQLSTCMHTDRPYLDPALSIDNLSQKLHIPVKSLSQAIHASLHQNFYDYINSHRIEEAKKRMNEGHYQNLTLLALAFDVGFNSKSVFNAAFKKHTGFTPKEYKHLQSSSSE